MPVCVRAWTRDACALLATPEGRVPLESGCPPWVMPNADGTGYYRWTLPPADLERLLDRGWPRLAPEERLSVADSLGAGFADRFLAVVPPPEQDAVLRRVEERLRPLLHHDGAWHVDYVRLRIRATKPG